jgi:2-dehydro-3-deoxygluconokinase
MISSRNVFAIGEAMIEFAPVDGGLYKRGVAGDTFNTAWHMAQMLGDQANVGFATRLGEDAVSVKFLEEMSDDGMEVSLAHRDSDRTMGLYLIELDGVERSFQYWRETSAAREMANDPSWLDKIARQSGLLHVSGITLAILSVKARARLIESLATARSNGAILSFDPNIRPKLWSSRSEIQETLSQIFEITDIALPSFDDELEHWGDGTPEVTIERLGAFGIEEIIVKNGANPVTFMIDGQVRVLDTPAVQGICDTTGAGDAFNAGYLSGRILGLDAEACIRQGMNLSAKVLCNYGARLPRV